MRDGSRPRRSAVVLSGGFSTRFGEADKAVADLAGTPMIRRVADRLDPVIDELVINCRAEQRESIRSALDGDPTFAIDPTPDLGPLGGIRTGIAASEAPLAAVVACDMPFVEPGLFEHLFSILETADCEGPDAAVVQLEDGWYQTTQAVYRTEPMAAACRDALEAGEGKILAALDRLEWVVVDAETVREHATLETFRSIDTQEELAEAEAEFDDE